MSNLILDNLTLVIMLPLWIFLIIMLGRFFSVYVNKTIINILTLISSLAGAVACTVAYFNIDSTLDWSLPFININEFVITFGIRVDRVSLILASLLFVISFLVHIFSVYYMKDEPKNYRFFALLNLFNFSMAFLIFSPNLFQFYVFWEIVGIVSYLLIGFDYTKEEKSVASKRVFVINRIGDTSLIAGIIFVSYFMYNYADNKLLASLSFGDMNSISAILSAYNSKEAFIAIGILFIIAGMVKSAQFPFHTWLQDAMEAKLPVSALLHSATMVVAGVYLIIQIMPILSLDNSLMQLISVIGIITVLICSGLACLERHPKKVLAYSTSASLGLMFMGLGTGNTNAVLIFLVAHAMIKSSLFMLLPNEDNKWNYIKAGLFTVNALCLIGLMFSGFAAKEILFASVYIPGKYIFEIAFILPALYISGLTCSLFKRSMFESKIQFLEIFPVVIMLLLNIGFYFVLRGSYTPIIPKILLVVFSILGIGCMYNFYKIPKIIEGFYNRILPVIYEKVSNAFNWIEINIFSRYGLVLGIARFNVKLFGLIEENIMNNSLRKISDFCKFVSMRDLIIQTKNVQSYNAYAFILITIVVTLIMIIVGKLN